MISPSLSGCLADQLTDRHCLVLYMCARNYRICFRQSHGVDEGVELRAVEMRRSQRAAEAACQIRACQAVVRRLTYYLWSVSLYYDPYTLTLYCTW